MEYVSSILECAWNIYQTYWNVSGICTGMCLEYIANTPECFLEYVRSILPCVWNMYQIHWNVSGLRNGTSVSEISVKKNEGI
jgi:hypothetical protein